MANSDPWNLGYESNNLSGASSMYDAGGVVNSIPQASLDYQNAWRQSILGPSYTPTSQSATYVPSGNQPASPSFSASSGGAQMGGSAGGSSAMGGGGYSSSSSTANPYLQQYGDALTQQSVQQFNQGVLPQIRSGAQAAGQYGSSRQGIAEGVAAGNASTGLGANLANLYSQGYNTNQNYNLGLGGLALQNQSMNNNFYTTNRQLDQSGAALGNTLYNSGVNGQLNLGNAQYTAGNTFQNAPMNTLNTYSNMVNPYTGLNQSNTGTNSAGGGVNGAIGGAMTAAQLWSILNGSAK